MQKNHSHYRNTYSQNRNGDDVRILVIDDEKIARMNIVKQLDPSFTIIECSTFEEAQMRLDKYKFDVCYIDLKLDDTNEMLGLKLIPIAVKKGIYTVVMTSIQDDAIAEKAYEEGCQDVFNKGNESANITETIHKYFLAKDNFTETCFSKYFAPTKNKALEKGQRRLAKFVQSDVPIFLKDQLVLASQQLPKQFTKCQNFLGSSSM